MIKLSDFSSFFVANWKLNGNFQFIDEFINNLMSQGEIEMNQNKE